MVAKPCKRTKVGYCAPVQAVYKAKIVFALVAVPLLVNAVLTIDTTVAIAGPLQDQSLHGSVFQGPLSESPAVALTNPSALTLGKKGWHLHFSSSLRLDDITIRRFAVAPGFAPVTSGGTTQRSLTLSPAGTAAGYLVSDKWSIAFLASLPTMETFTDEPDWRYHSSGGYQATLATTIAVGLRIVDKIRIGFSASITGSLFRSQFSRDTILDDGTTGVEDDCNGSPCGFENPLAEETYDIRASSLRLNSLLNGVVLAAGVTLRPTKNTWIGIGYQTRTTPVLLGEATVQKASRDGGETVTANAELPLPRPRTISLGLKGQWLPSYDIVAYGRLQTWSDLSQFDYRLYGATPVPLSTEESYRRYTGLQNTLRIELGIEQKEKISEYEIPDPVRGPRLVEQLRRLRWGARLSYETAATDDASLSPLFVEGKVFSASAGLGIRLRPTLSLQIGYSLDWYPRVDSIQNLFDPNAAVACIDSGNDFSQCSVRRQGQDTASAAGVYSRFAHTARFSLQYDFL